MRTERAGAVALGPVSWGGRRGAVALAPGYPTGGSQGGHIIFRWRQEGSTFVLGMHAWELFSEAYATLRRVAHNLPPPP